MKSIVQMNQCNTSHWIPWKKIHNLVVMISALWDFADKLDIKLKFRTKYLPINVLISVSGRTGTIVLEHSWLAFNYALNIRRHLSTYHHAYVCFRGRPRVDRYPQRVLYIFTETKRSPVLQLWHSCKITWGHAVWKTERNESDIYHAVRYTVALRVARKISLHVNYTHVGVRVQNHHPCDHTLYGYYGLTRSLWY